MLGDQITSRPVRNIIGVVIVILIILDFLLGVSIIQCFCIQIQVDSITGNIEISYENETVERKTIWFINECNEDVWFGASVRFINFTQLNATPPKVGLYDFKYGKSAEGQLYKVKNERGNPMHLRLLIEQEDERFVEGNLTVKAEIFVRGDIFFIGTNNYKVKENSITIPIYSYL